MTESRNGDEAMADERRDDDRHDGADVDPTMPTWVKAFVAAGILVILLGAVVALGGGDHGPGRHTPGGAGTERETPSGHTRPADADH